jgi:hypothetical protein
MANIAEDFVALFNGKESVAGRAQGYRDAVAWLREGNAQRKMFSCLVFYEKPIEVLATGRTRAGLGDGNAVQNGVLAYLPQHTAPYSADVEARPAARYGHFQHVNFSMIKRVALLALQKRWVQHAIFTQWYTAYGGLPMAVNFSTSRWTSMAPETLEIKRPGIQAFVEDVEFWMDLQLQ